MPSLVSIVIPVYNGSNFLGAAIQSALAQTWKHTEVIVINDGSTDGGATASIAKSFGDRIKYIEKPNGGVASALNAGIAAMSGDVFCWLSHDDRHLRHKTKRQMTEWAASGFSEKVFFSDYRVINSSGAKVQDVILDHALLTDKPAYSLIQGAIHGCSVFIPRPLLDRFGPFDEKLPTTQDYDLWHRMQRASVPFIHIPEILVDSRSHDAQASKLIAHSEEANQFLIRVFSEITRNERMAIEVTEQRFAKKFAKFVALNGHVVAAKQALIDVGLAGDDEVAASTLERILQENRNTRRGLLTKVAGRISRSPVTTRNAFTRMADNIFA